MSDNFPDGGNAGYAEGGFTAITSTSWLSRPGQSLAGILIGLLLRAAAALVLLHRLRARPA